MNKKQKSILLSLIIILPSVLFSMSDNEKFDALIQKEIIFAANLPHQTFRTAYNHLKGYFTEKSKGKTEQEQMALKAKLVSFAEKTVPICHDQALIKAADYLLAKKESKSSIEQNVYADMLLPAYIFRLYHNRPLVCYKPKDDTLLFGETNTRCEAYDQHAAIGTDTQQSPFILQDLISYEEREISQLFGIASPTFFINNGDWGNVGVMSTTDNFEQEGLLVGLVGPRYELPKQMACKELIDEKDQQDGDILITDDNIRNSSCKSLAGKYFRPSKHIQRIKLSIEPFLHHANQEDHAYIHAIGLGLGWWAMFKEHTDEKAQEIQCSFIAYKQLLEENKFDNIDTIDFSWFTNNNITQAADLFKQINNNKLSIDNNPHITIKFSLRNTANKLIDKDKDKRLVAMYPWDPASGPGNEFLLGALAGSGDPAAVCCSLIFSLQHTRINGDNIFNNIMKRLIPFVEKYPRYKSLMPQQQVSDNPNNATTPSADPQELTDPANPGGNQSDTKGSSQEPKKPLSSWNKFRNLSIGKQITLTLIAAGFFSSLYYYFIHPSVMKNIS